MPLPRGQRVHELPARIKATRRSAYSDNREFLIAARRATRRQRAPARSRPDRFGLTQMGRLSPDQTLRHEVLTSTRTVGQG